MPLYFFHIDHTEQVIDTHGLDLPDITVARFEACKATAEILRDGAAAWDTRPWLMRFTDDTGLILFALELNATNSPACGEN